MTPTTDHIRALADRIALYPLPGNLELARSLGRLTGAPIGILDVGRFPDGETRLRVEPPDAEPGEDLAEAARRRTAVLVCTLAHPDEKLLPLVFAAETLRELGAPRIGLVAPYLAYMRQDRHFEPGDAETSRHFAVLLSRAVDWLVTVDPHLHRHHALGEIYGRPTVSLTAAPLLAEWLRANAPDGFVVGPDDESRQWVERVAALTGFPAVIADKERIGDRTVRIGVPDVRRWRGRTPVLVDDIIATGQTMAETVRHLSAAGFPPAVCAGVHGIFAGTAEADLRAAGAGRIVTTDTVPHPTNAVSVAGLIAGALAELPDAGARHRAPAWRAAAS